MARPPLQHEWNDNGICTVCGAWLDEVSARYDLEYEDDE